VADSDIVNAFNSIIGKGSLDSVEVVQERIIPTTQVQTYVNSSSESTVKQFRQNLPKTVSSA